MILNVFMDTIVHSFFMLCEYLMAPWILLTLTFITNLILGQEKKLSAPHPLLHPGLEYLLLGSVGFGALALRGFSENVSDIFSGSCLILCFFGFGLTYRYVGMIKSVWIDDKEFLRFIIPVKAAAVYQLLLIQFIFLFIYLEHIEGHYHRYTLLVLHVILSIVSLVLFLILVKFLRQLNNVWAFYDIKALEEIKNGHNGAALRFFQKALQSAKEMDKVRSTVNSLSNLLYSDVTPELLNVKSYLIILGKKGSPNEVTTLRMILVQLCLDNKIDSRFGYVLAKMSINRIPMPSQYTTARGSLQISSLKPAYTWPLVLYYNFRLALIKIF